MTDPRTDEIAARAAKLLARDAGGDVRSAIGAAIADLGYADAPPPRPGLVRDHLRAQTMESLGIEGYEAAVHARLRVAEELMTVLEEMLPDVETLLVGRAAAGDVDGPGRMHLRVYTDHDIGALAEVIVEHGYEEPTFETASTRRGRLSRMNLMSDGIAIVVTRCPQELRASRTTDLFHGRPIHTLTLAELRRQIEAD